jgi:hypothetical protein
MGLGFLDQNLIKAEESIQTREVRLNGLRLGCADGEWIVRYAAVVGLENFSKQAPEPFAKASLELLQARSAIDVEEIAVVRLRALKALHHGDQQAVGDTN